MGIEPTSEAWECTGARTVDSRRGDSAGNDVGLRETALAAHRTRRSHYLRGGFRIPSMSNAISWSNCSITGCNAARRRDSKVPEFFIYVTLDSRSAGAKDVRALVLLGPSHHGEVQEWRSPHDRSGGI